MRRSPLGPPPQETAAEEQDAAAAYRARVLRNFFNGERRKSIPAQRKQRVIILQELMERFDPARTFAEREVNEMLRPAHEDVASLRRELVDYGYLTRERGIYQVAHAPPARSKQVAQEITGDERAWLGAFIRAAVGTRRQ